ALVARIRSQKWAGKKLFMALFVTGVAVAAFCWGRHGAAGRATAQAPAPRVYDPPPQAIPTAGSDYSRRVVAFIYGNVPITREDRGESLIPRSGAERVDSLANRRIIDMACRARNVTVTDAEVDAQLKQDLASFGGGLTEKQFVDN